ncbi:MAG: Arylesterase [Paucimonas sp.]|jgi:acyl-CoA thioesterase-1|nr:Arylesterase [Paucimonas sp.]
MVRKIALFWQALLFSGLAALSMNAYSASKTILVFGDSLSAEYGLAQGSGWVPLLAQRLKQQKPEWTIVNASISGETTGGGRVRLSTLLAKHRPAIVILELGANDALRGLSLKSAEQNLKTMILQSQKAGAKVVLLGMKMPPNYGAGYASRFEKMFTSLARETTSALVPFFLAKLGTDETFFQPDRLHPTAAAQPLLLDTVWPHLQPLIKK